MEDYEEEKITVLVELTGIIDTDFLLQEHHNAKILGIDTANPVLQIDNYIFSGEYQDIKGTAVIFEEHETDGDEVELSYHNKTFKKLAMKRVFLQEKTPKIVASGAETIAGTMDCQSHTDSHASNNEHMSETSSQESSAKVGNNTGADSCPNAQNPGNCISALKNDAEMEDCEGKLRDCSLQFH